MDNKVHLTHARVNSAAREAANTILGTSPPVPVCLYGVPRGGIPAAYLVRAHIEKAGHPCEIVDTPEACHVIIDDIVDSGRTRDKHLRYNERLFISLFNAQDFDAWIVFPWEKGTEDHSAEDIPVRLLQYIGEDVSRGGLKETPKRFLKAWNHYTSGYKQSPEEILKVFEDGAENYDEMVLVRDIPVYSHCEHHLAPFFGTAHVGYIPSGRIVGLSKLSRLVDIFARRLQVQERLTNEIATAINKYLEPKGVAVVINCRHMCMEARGIQRQGSSTITSSMRGALLNDAKARLEFMELIK